MERFLGPLELLNDAGAAGMPRVIIHVTHLNTKQPISEEMLKEAANLLVDYQPAMSINITRNNGGLFGTGNTFCMDMSKKNHIPVEKRTELDRGKWREIVHAELNKATFSPTNKPWKIIYIEYSTESLDEERTIVTDSGQEITFIFGTLIVKFDSSITDSFGLFDLVQNQLLDIIHDYKLGEEDLTFTKNAILMHPAHELGLSKKFKSTEKEWQQYCKKIQKPKTAPKSETNIKTENDTNGKESPVTSAKKEKSETNNNDKGKGKPMKKVTYSPIYEEIQAGTLRPRYTITKRRVVQKPMLFYQTEFYGHSEQTGTPEDITDDTKIRAVPFSSVLSKQILHYSQLQGLSVTSILITACAYALGHVFDIGAQEAPREFKVMFPIDLRMLSSGSRSYSLGNCSTVGLVSVELPRSGGVSVSDFWTEVTKVSRRIREYIEKEKYVRLFADVVGSMKKGKSEILKEKLGVHFEVDYLGKCDKQAENPLEKMMHEIADPFAAKHYFFKSFSTDSVTSLRHGFCLYDGQILMSITHMERWLPTGLIQEYIKVLQADLYILTDPKNVHMTSLTKLPPLKLAEACSMRK